MFLKLPREVIRSMARFKLCIHILRVETLAVTWAPNTSPTCDRYDANGVRDEQHVLFLHPWFKRKMTRKDLK